jgi:hypothetical protein
MPPATALEAQIHDLKAQVHTLQASQHDQAVAHKQHMQQLQQMQLWYMQQLLSQQQQGHVQPQQIQPQPQPQPQQQPQQPQHYGVPQTNPNTMFPTWFWQVLALCALVVAFIILVCIASCLSRVSKDVGKLRKTMQTTMVPGQSSGGRLVRSI